MEENKKTKTLSAPKKFFFFILFVILFLLIIEIIIKGFFAFPYAHSKMQEMLFQNDNRAKNIQGLGFLVWDKDLNYKWKNGINLKRFFQFNIFSDDYNATVNTDGFRVQPENTLEAIKKYQGKKIICLGDSWTMGWGVDVDYSYPMQLQKILDTQMPDEGYKVFNLGAITYTSFQGLKIMEKINTYINPEDIVILGYQANDPRHGFVFEDIFNKGNYFLKEKEFNDIVFHIERGFTTLKLVKTLLSLSTNKPSDYFWDFPPRISYEEYLNNNLKMVKMIKSKGANPVLFYHGLFKEQDYTAKAMYQVAHLADIPVVNVRDSLLRQERIDIDALEDEYPKLLRDDTAINLPSGLSGQDGIKITFRLKPFHDQTHLALDSSSAEKIEVATLGIVDGKYGLKKFVLNDNGDDGDEIAGDGIWSRTVSLSPDPKLYKIAPVYIDGEFQNRYDLYAYFYYIITVNDGSKKNIYPEFVTAYPIVPLYVNIWREINIGELKIDNDQIQYEDLLQQPFSFYDRISPIFLLGKQFQRSEFLHPTQSGYSIYADEVFKTIQNIN